jgi:sugar lactone lactonase YvrE
LVKIECVVESNNYLGEGPIWDPNKGVLYWVDIEGPFIWRYEPRSDKSNKWKMPMDVAAVFPRAQGGNIIALADGFYFIDFETGKTELVAKVDNDKPRVRMNDTKADRRGRLFTGGEDQDESAALAGLYRLNADLSLHKLEDGIICNNGPCFSPDDKTFYRADSFKQEIYAYDYDIETGAISNKRVFVSTKDDPGLADGSTVDEEGYLWNAQIIAGKLMRYAPDGSLDRTIEMPVRNITSVMFGGDALDTLYVTSMARVDHPGGGVDIFVKEDKPQPNAGSLFAVTGLGVRGLPETPFAG